jgi:3'-5' exoribonuclease
MILSHHGEMEFGSPKVPLFAEALLLHYLDNLDSKLDAIRRGAEKDRQIEGAWSSHVPGLDRYVLKKDRYLNGGDPTSAPPPSPPAPPVQSQPSPSPASGAQSSPRSEPAAPSESVFAERLKQALGGQ